MSRIISNVGQPVSEQSSDGETLETGETLSETLWYTCLNEWDGVELSSRHFEDKIELVPEFLKKNFCISELEYDWLTITAFAKQKNWEKVELMVQKASGFLNIGAALRGPKYDTALETKHLVDILDWV